MNFPDLFDLCLVPCVQTVKSDFVEKLRRSLKVLPTRQREDNELPATVNFLSDMSQSDVQQDVSLVTVPKENMFFHGA